MIVVSTRVVSVCRLVEAPKNLDIMECALPERAAETIAYYFDLLNLVFVSLVAVYMTFFCLNTENEWLLNWHVWLCTIGVSKFVKMNNNNHGSR